MPSRRARHLLIAVLASAALAASARGEERVVTVGVYDSQPMLQVAADGTASGLFVDLVDRIAADEGWRVRYVPGSWQESFAAVREGRVDLLACVAYSDERTAYLDYSRDHVFLDWAVVFQRKRGGIATPFDLQDKRVGCMAGSIYEGDFAALLKPLHVACGVVEFPGSEEAMRALDAGAVDAAICSNFYGLRLQERYAVERTAIVFSPVRVMFAARKGAHADLIAAIDRRMGPMKADPNSYYWSRYRAWVGRESAGFPAWARWAIGGCAAAVALLIAFSYALKREVRARTAELQGSLEALGRSEESFRGLTTTLEARIAERTRELSAALDAAGAANRAKSAFLASLSHEIRTPLNAILGYAQMLGRDAGLASDHRRAAAVINRSGEHLLSLIEDLLELSRIEAGRQELRPEVFDLGALLAGLRDVFLLSARDKGLALQLEIDPALPRLVRADQRKLRQILFNLLANAVKFTDRGAVALSAVARGGRLELAVRDTGRGIAPEELARLFVPFAQGAEGRRRGDGTGLGLALGRGFAEAMGGTLGAVSAVGVGSTFTCAIALETVADDRAAPESSPARPPAIRPLRVLIAEDHADSRALLADLLGAAGHRVDAVADGARAVAAFAAPDPPDLAIVDLDLPVLDGLAAIRRIRAEARGRPPLIALTAAAGGAAERERLLAAGCDEVVAKPYREAELFAAIARQVGAARAAGGDDASDDGYRAAVAALPAAELARLRAAMVVGELDAIGAVVAALSDRRLAARLRLLVERLAFDRLQALLHPGGATP